MKVETISCPNCNAALDLLNKSITDRDSFFCPYCGSRIYIDDGVKRKAVYVKTEHHRVDEAKVKRVEADLKSAEIQKEIEQQKLEYQERKEKRDNRMLWLIMLLILAFSVGMFAMTSWDEMTSKRQEAQMKEKGMVSVGYSSDYVGEDYESVVMKLEALGFKNIETVDLDDSGILFFKNHNVESITINGDSSFSSSDYFSVTDKVVITYH